MKPRIRQAVRSACIWALALVLAGCALSEAEKHAAARSVDELLRARQSRSTDAATYARFLKSSDVATALAEDASATAKADKPALPGWERPYVSRLTTSGADVIVVWKKDDRLPEWPSAADEFVTEKVGDRWVVVDARSLESSAIPKPWTP